MDDSNAVDPGSTVGGSRVAAPDDRGRDALLQDLLAAKEELAGRNEVLRLVNDLSLRLQRGLDLPTLAAQTVDSLSRCSGSPLAAFHILEGPEGPLRLVAEHGFSERERSWELFCRSRGARTAWPSGSSGSRGSRRSATTWATGTPSRRRSGTGRSRPASVSP